MTELVKIEDIRLLDIVDLAIDRNKTVCTLVSDVAVLKSDVAVLKSDMSEVRSDIFELKASQEVMGQKLDVILDHVKDIPTILKLVQSHEQRITTLEVARRPADSGLGR